MKNNYYIQKDNNTENIVLVEFNEMDGYHITPKIKKEDTIEVNKIVFVSKSLSEKIIKKKIEHKIAYLLGVIEDNDSSEDGVKQSLMDAEKLRLMIINNYKKYLGNTYQDLTLRKMRLIIKKLRYKLYLMHNKVDYLAYQDNYNYQNYEEEKKGRGR